MTTLQIDSGVIGAKRQSWKRANPRDVLIRIVDKNHEWDEAQVQTECWTIVHGDPQQMRTIFEYWFANNYRSLMMKSPTSRERTSPQEARKTAAETTRAIRTKIEETITQRVKISLLDMILPSGRTLRHSTREELLDLGGWVTAVADQMEPNQTVAEAGLTESDLRALYED